MNVAKQNLEPTLRWHGYGAEESLESFGNITSMEDFWVARARNRVIGVYLTAADARAAVTRAAIDDGYSIAID
jgi:hypothetical protein